MELRSRNGRAVLVERGQPRDGEHRDGEHAPERLPLEPELVAALHEWARVASSVGDPGSDGRVPDGTSPAKDGQSMVASRGRQLAGRVAARMRTTVHVIDPVTGFAVPDSVAAAQGRAPRRHGAARLRSAWPFGRSWGEQPPWGPGLVVSAFVCAFVFVGMLALIRAMSVESGVLATGAALLVTSGLAPSIWLGRTVPLLRWVCLGAGVGLAVSWVGLLVIVL